MKFKQWLNDGGIRNDKLHIIGTCQDCENEGDCDIQNFIFRSPEYSNTDEFGCTRFAMNEAKDSSQDKEVRIFKLPGG